MALLEVEAVVGEVTKKGMELRLEKLKARLERSRLAERLLAAADREWPEAS